ncbi:hypothetical protein BH10ACI1_BH10ACI1_16610 [soil metagenome]
MLKKILIPTIFVLLSVISAFAQNRFEGYNIILSAPDNHTSATCALRYAPPTASITISDLNTATPMNVKSCDGSGTSLTKSGTTATMKANAQNLKWCFEGEDKMYRVSFNGDQFSGGGMTYNWIATPDEKTLGFYNIKDFGAVGDGRTDDTVAIKSAFAFVASHNGGQVTFPEGEYMVSSPITLPSGIVIQGIDGLHSDASTNNVVRKNNSRITLVGSNRALFRIGECTEKVTIRDIELYGQSQDRTYGIEAVGAFISSQGFFFERVTFQKFFRGIYGHGLAVTNLEWQFDYVKVLNSRFIYNSDAGLYTNMRNSDWKIEGCLFINPRRTPTQHANSMDFERIGMVTIADTFGGGFANAKGGTFINILDSGNMTIIGSQTEAMTNSIVYNEVENPYAGDYSYPITVVNSIFGDPILFKARRTFVSTGSLYNGNTFTADERLRVYSTGDRFCYDGYILGCQGATKKNFDRATIIFMTGMPGERDVPSTPTIFGTDVEFGAPIQLPSFLQTALPTGKGNGSLVYCSNCRRSTTPCQAGGTGAPAMVIGNQWSCL